MLKFFLLALAATTFFSFARAQSPSGLRKMNMRKLGGFVGVWNAKTIFHLRDGRTTTETGIYNVSWTLDSCYQQWNLELQNDSTNRKRSMLILVTFNPDSSRYEVNYFYASSAMKVFEIGKVNSDNEFLTTAFVPLEDGKHDENVRTITKLITADKIQYLHFSRFDYEKEERKDFEANLTRMN